ncbi:MAG: hypothetical protein AAF587_32815 [Bacteroidota bacterium]
MEHIDPTEQEVELTMNSLDGLERAKPKPFFHTRLEARLAAEKEAESGIFSWLLQPKVQWAMLICLLLLNVGVVVGFGGQENSSVASEPTDLMSAMVQEYSFQTSSSLYDFQDF